MMNKQTKYPRKKPPTVTIGKYKLKYVQKPYVDRFVIVHNPGHDLGCIGDATMTVLGSFVYKYGCQAFPFVDLHTLKVCCRFIDRMKEYDEWLDNHPSNG